jgi:hypothetical protein
MVVVFVPKGECSDDVKATVFSQRSIQSGLDRAFANSVCIALALDTLSSGVAAKLTTVWRLPSNLYAVQAAVPAGFGSFKSRQKLPSAVIRLMLFRNSSRKYAVICR